MLFSSYSRLKLAKYFLYGLFDILLTYCLVRYLAEGIFQWTFFFKILLLVLGCQLVFVLRDGLVNFVFMHLNQQTMIDGLVKEFTTLGFPKALDGIDSPVHYFERIQSDSALGEATRLGAAKYLTLIGAIQTSASGWINHQVYTSLLEKSIHQFAFKN